MATPHSTALYPAPEGGPGRGDGLRGGLRSGQLQEPPKGAAETEAGTAGRAPVQARHCLPLPLLPPLLRLQLQLPHQVLGLGLLAPQGDDLWGETSGQLMCKHSEPLTPAAPRPVTSPYSSRFTTRAPAVPQLPFRPRVTRAHMCLRGHLGAPKPTHPGTSETELNLEPAQHTAAFPRLRI